MVLLVSIITFVTALCIVLGVWVLAGGDVTEDVVRQRLDAVRMAERRGSESPDLQIIRDETLSAMPQLNRILMQWSWVGRLSDFIAQAGLTVRPAKILC